MYLRDLIQATGPTPALIPVQDLWITDVSRLAAQRLQDAHR